MRSVTLYTLFALAGLTDLAAAGRCAPSPTTTPGPLVVRNVVIGGNFASPDPAYRRDIAAFDSEGNCQLITGRGYQGDGSTEKGCVVLDSDETVALSKRQTGDWSVMIEQMLDNLNVANLYTIRFFYAILKNDVADTCRINAYYGDAIFASTPYFPVTNVAGNGYQWLELIEQFAIKSASGYLRFALHCADGGHAQIYIDQVFMSDQVTPANIDSVSLLYVSETSGATSHPTSSSTAALSTTSGGVSASTTSTSQTGATGSQSTGTGSASSVASSPSSSSSSGTTSATSSGSSSQSLGTTSTTGSSESTSQGTSQSSTGTSGQSTTTRTTSSDSSLNTPGSNSQSSTATPSQSSPVGTPSDGSSQSTPGGASQSGTGTSDQATPAATTPGSSESTTRSSSNETPTVSTPTTSTTPANTPSVNAPSNTPSTYTPSSNTPINTPSGTPSNTPPSVAVDTPLINTPWTTPSVTSTPSSTPTSTTAACTSTGYALSATPDASYACNMLGLYMYAYEADRTAFPNQKTPEDCAYICSQINTCKASTYRFQYDKCEFSDQYLTDDVFSHYEGGSYWSEQRCWNDHACLDGRTTTTTTSAAATTTSCSETGYATLSVVDSGAVCGSVGLYMYAYEADRTTFPNQKTSEDCAYICSQISTCKASTYRSQYDKCEFSDQYLTSDVFSSYSGGSPWYEQRCWDAHACLDTKSTTTTSCAETGYATVTAVQSDWVCQSLGLYMYAYEADRTTFPNQATAEDCAYICSQIGTCKASTYRSQYDKCEFSDQYLTSDVFSSYEAGSYWYEQRCWDAHACLDSSGGQGSAKRFAALWNAKLASTTLDTSVRATATGV